MGRIRPSNAQKIGAGANARARRTRPPSLTGRLIECAFLSSLLVLAVGCAVTEETKQSLAAYVQAMDQVDRSANEFLSDFSNGLKVQSELERVAGVSKPRNHVEFPDAFEPPGDPSVPQTDAEKAVASTRQALAVIRSYNEALVALAEGHTEAEIRTRAVALGGALDTVVSIAGASLPVVGQFAGLGAKIVKLAQDAQNRAELERAVMQGREPVGVILTALEDQTTPMYRRSVVVTKRGQTKLRNDIRRAAFPLRTFLGRYSLPTDETIAGERAAYQLELQAIGARTKTLPAMPIPFPHASGRPAYDRGARAEMDVFMSTIRAADQKYAELVAKQNAYYALMGKYVSALRQTRRSLDLVAASLDRPMDLRGEVNRLLEVAFDLRDAMSEFRNPTVTPMAL